MLINPLWSKKVRQVLGVVETVSDIDEVISIDEEGESDALQSGLRESDIDKIWDAVEGLYKSGMHPGIGFCLRKNGHIVLNRSIGHATLDEYQQPDRLMTTDTPICLYSASKAITAMAVHKLAEDGMIKLLDPVSYYLPEFGRKGKEDVSIYQLLIHRGGFPQFEGEVEPETIYDRDKVLDHIYHTESWCEQGRIQAYHALTSGFIFDEICRITTGKDINAYVQKVFARPMQMKSFRYGLTKSRLNRAADNYVTGMKSPDLVASTLANVMGAPVPQAVAMSNSPEFKQAIIPSANMFTTAEQTSRFFQMMIDEGRYKNKQILQPVTVRKAIREVDKLRLDKSIYLPMKYSAGFMLGGSPMGMYGPNTGQAFGHLGFSNIFCWADPARDISVALLNTGKPILGTHVLALPKLMYQINKVCA